MTDPTLPTVLIAGCGDLGIETGRRFAALGHRVVGLRRDASKIPAPLHGVSIDLRREIPEVTPDVGIVVVAVAAGERSAEAYRATYLDGLRNVLDGVERAGVSPRILLVSSTAVYDVDDGSVVDESTPATSAAPTATVLRETEELLAERAPGGVILRLGGIYGPGRDRTFTQVREGRARIPAVPRHLNHLHRDDAAEAIVHLTTRVEDPAPLYLGVDDDPADVGETLAFIARELDLPEPFRESAAEGGRAGGPGDKRCSNALLRSTGFMFAYPSYREGYPPLLRGE
ncbi:hypothetical protein AS850_12800 [Frondihabitans sp. 762G35]|uniref:NAD-dependent epimerase/dehydratase family protein n=1 Tax=Frondihabitans sp. 762G35 TaxID=1446794 RepID=UPI000D20B7AB|nr:NAD-dependent epimerase/dehydratase family protein [Frondihabitans sp. 762G35]ARC57956.1 hypothetical protein AS850_12800 [Frondihabitans sp. 762G35]